MARGRGRPQAAPGGAVAPRGGAAGRAGAFLAPSGVWKTQGSRKVARVGTEGVGVAAHGSNAGQAGATGERGGATTRAAGRFRPPPRGGGGSRPAGARRRAAAARSAGGGGCVVCAVPSRGPIRRARRRHQRQQPLGSPEPWQCERSLAAGGPARGRQKNARRPRARRAAAPPAAARERVRRRARAPRRRRWGRQPTGVGVGRSATARKVTVPASGKRCCAEWVRTPPRDSRRARRHA
jgi:hypothetical protein